ncbi:unnamed protein product [Auanema sp. JU1783]|nr:unnamed protein product [Auanema sp. JU1783]
MLPSSDAYQICTRARGGVLLMPPVPRRCSQNEPEHVITTKVQLFTQNTTAHIWDAWRCINIPTETATETEATGATSTSSASIVTATTTKEETARTDSMESFDSFIVNGQEVGIL